MATAILGPAEALRPGDVKVSADGQYRYLPGRRGSGSPAAERGRGVGDGDGGDGDGVAGGAAGRREPCALCERLGAGVGHGTAGTPGAWLALAEDALTLRDSEGGTL